MSPADIGEIEGAPPKGDGPGSSRENPEGGRAHKLGTRRAHQGAAEGNERQTREDTKKGPVDCPSQVAESADNPRYPSRDRRARAQLPWLREGLFDGSRSKRRPAS